MEINIHPRMVNMEYYLRGRNYVGKATTTGASDCFNLVNWSREQMVTLDFKSIIRIVYYSGTIHLKFKPA